MCIYVMFCLFVIVLQQFDFCLVSFITCLLALFACLKCLSTFYTLHWTNTFNSPRIHNFLHIDFFFAFDVCASTRNFQSKPLPSNRFNSFFSLLSESDVCTKCFFNSSCIDGLLCTMANDLVGWLSWKIWELANTARISGAKNGTFVWICR